MAEYQTPTEASLLSTSSAIVKDAEVQVDTTQMNGTSTEDPPLFSATLIPADVAAALPEDYSIRPLRRSDYYNGTPASSAQATPAQY